MSDSRYAETIAWLRERAEIADQRGQDDVMQDNRELADLAEQRSERAR